MKAFIHLIQRYATGKHIAVLFMLTMAVYILMLSYSIPAVSAFAPELPLFDLSPSGYSYAYANELLYSLGAEGRDLYLFTQLPLDFIYPGMFSITYSLLLAWVFGKIFLTSSRINYCLIVPFLAGIFDYAENLFIIKMLSSYPDLQVGTVKIASTFTILKSSFTLLFFVLLAVGLVLLLKQKLTNTRK